MVDTTNIFEVLENYNTYELIQYKSNWLLDNVARSVFSDMNKIVQKQKKLKDGSDVKVETSNKYSNRFHNFRG